MSEGKGRFTFEQVHHSDRGLFLSTRWTIGLKTMPVFMTDRKLLGKLLGKVKRCHSFS